MDAAAVSCPPKPAAWESVAQADLLGLTADAFTAALHRAIGHSARFHRALYRQVITTGSLAPQTVPLWQEAGAAARAAVAQLPAPPLPTVEAVQREGEGAQATQKLLLRLADGARIESVLIPMRAGAHRTLCVSSQVGCRMGCTFCATASMGLVRQLRAGEIVAQAVCARALLGGPPRNVVFMGMGEPLDNAAAVAQAVAVLTDPAGWALAPRHLTISTVGRLEGLAAWAELGLSRVNLAVSLGSALPTVRERLMPIARLSPLDRLRAALLALPLRPGARILISCIVIPGVTDTPAALTALVDWLAGLPALVNLIPFNPIPGAAWRAPTAAEVIAMRDALDRAGVPVRLRTTRGSGVNGACGQLATARERRVRPVA